jgi:FG-GAP-like repeat
VNFSTNSSTKLRCLLLIVVAAITSHCHASALNFINSSTNFVSQTPVSLVLADVNGDGKPDFITGQYGYQTMTIYTNNGNGTFSFCSTNVLGGGAGGFSLVAADFNQDGKMDVVCLHEATSDNHLTLLTNDGTGVFTAASLPGPVAYPPTAITGGDINGDGRTDLVVAHSGFAALTVLTNNGAGIFSPASTNGVGAGPVCTVVTDVNGDMKPDVISFNGGVYSTYQGSITVLTNNGLGTLAPNATYTTATSISWGIVADVNADGKPDLIWDNWSLATTYAGTITIFTNNGHGLFVSNAVYNVGNNPAGLVAADLNGDGKLDLACVCQRDNDVIVLTNNGAGRFVPACTNITGYAPAPVVAGDLNGDGKMDLVCANTGTNTATVLLNSPPLPSINLQPAAANTINLSWSAAWPGFGLKQIQDLTLANWVNVTNSVITTNGTSYVVISPGAGNAFYRLAHP